MTNIFIIVAVLVLFFIIIQKYVVKSDDTKDHNYQKKSNLLNMQEGAFYNALKSAVGEHGAVFAKVNMSSVVTPAKARNKKDWFIANNKISRSYFDFVVCDPRSMEIRVVIALDNGKELNKGKAEREKLLMHVCKTANIPLIGASVRHSYQVSRLKRLLAAHIDLIEPEKEVRFCRKCGSPMIIKVASQGEFKGRRFFTCSRQPNCTYTENYNVVFEMDSEE
ncbi:MULTISPECIES: DUF2726 domain-containing protein [Vibrio]|uniref:DUF2726 domain-containing protein n=2 Tax=Vibrio TaxID=662 RepID=A0A1E5CVP3_9VIBR|nr:MULTISPECIES: DUF2726 domain-containing protein [Vibrio]MDN3696954.1 DUF2726 domain-containing protein [Vibrio cortegadensis]NOH84315.1 DUF2726 domain-containing protein [Vibrio sp. 03-59-1]OEE74070.1 hypothetical protein A130_18195 [Vibrio genomosp. F6 str. FF-238]RBW66844.1 DUF2726 domain-containing protein [Vibrionales bacterium C3R12]